MKEGCIYYREDLGTISKLGLILTYLPFYLIMTIMKQY